MGDTMLNRLALIAALSGLAGCPSISTLGAARTIDRGTSQFFIAPEVTYFTLGEKPLVKPQVEFGVRYGLTDKLELGGKVWLPGIAADAKIALLRAKSPDAGLDVALNPGFSYLGGFSGTRSGEGSSLHTFTLFVPLLLGLNVGGGHQLVLAPRVIDQLFMGSGSDGGAANIVYAGTSLGFVFKVGPSFRLMPEVSVGVPIVGTVSGFGTDVGVGALIVQGGVGLLLGGG
jgi:hypothetical protein